VYADDRAWDDGLVRAILRPTEHRHGHAAFTSILFAPKAPHTFEEYLAKVKAPILMLYGKGRWAVLRWCWSDGRWYVIHSGVCMCMCELTCIHTTEDPWVTPAWGQKAKRQRPDARYIEISPAGHCECTRVQWWLVLRILVWPAVASRRFGCLGSLTCVAC